MTTRTYDASARLTPANVITVGRLLSSPVLFAMVLSGGPSYGALALGTLIAVTDGLDGYLARRQGIPFKMHTLIWGQQQPAWIETLSAADQLVSAGKVTAEVVDGMRREMRDVQNDPDAVFFYSFVQAQAVVY